MTGQYGHENAQAIPKRFSERRQAQASAGKLRQAQAMHKTRLNRDHRHKKSPEGLICSGYGPSKGPAQPARNQFSGLRFCAWPLNKLCMPGFFIMAHENGYQLII
jgi:hypothetical protein